jgi:hypothetical protein
MTDLTKLKAGSKGAPPALEEAPRNTERAPRDKVEATRPLQFIVPESVFEAYSIEAVKQGGGKGAKSALFLKLWDAYYSKNDL